MNINKICLIILIIFFITIPIVQSIIEKSEIHYSNDIWKFINRLTLDKCVTKIKLNYGFTLFCGRQGGGKTYCAVKYASDLCLKNGSLLVSNTPLNVPKDINYIYLRDLKEIKYLPKFDSYVILLDEIQTLFDSYKMDEEFYTIFCQLRKRNIKIVGTAQVFERVSLKLREQVHDLYYCKTYFGCLTRLTKYFPDLNNDGKMKADKLRLDRQYIIQTDYIRNMYDTFYRI